ncbi:MAG: iron-sulfur cluster assembly scaffold protein [Desulfatiglandales bacterium]
MLDFFLYLLTAFGVLFGVVCLWIAVYYWTNPRVENPDGNACITGTCGDTMEIRLRFQDDKVVETSHWTDGCAYSLNCVYAAARLARGMTPDQILEIDSDTIKESIGGLPSDHTHCARLAYETLQAALDDYMRKQTRRPPQNKKECHHLFAQKKP